MIIIDIKNISVICRKNKFAICNLQFTLKIKSSIIMLFAIIIMNGTIYIYCYCYKSILGQLSPMARTFSANLQLHKLNGSIIRWWPLMEFTCVKVISSASVIIQKFQFLKRDEKAIGLYICCDDSYNDHAMSLRRNMQTKDDAFK